MPTVGPTDISKSAEKQPFCMNFSRHEIVSRVIKTTSPPSFSFHVWLKRLVCGCGLTFIRGMRVADCYRAFSLLHSLVCQPVGIPMIFTELPDTWLCLTFEVTLHITVILGWSQLCPGRPSSWNCRALEGMETDTCQSAPCVLCACLVLCMWGQHVV